MPDTTNIERHPLQPFLPKEFAQVGRKRLEVVAAVIYDAEGRIFATQRGYGEWKDWWEFPGGKTEAGETPQEALRREIREELDAEIEVGERLVECVIAAARERGVRIIPVCSYAQRMMSGKDEYKDVL